MSMSLSQTPMLYVAISERTNAIVALPEQAHQAHMQEMHQALTQQLSHRSNRPYLDALLQGRPRVAMARLSALSLLPPLLCRAGVCPVQVMITRDARNRPCIHLEGDGPAMDFNLSHSATHAACALWRGEGRVGIDIEEPISQEKAAQIAKRYFFPGEKAWLDTWAKELGDAAAFTRLWTRKEAMSKQDGRGNPLLFDASALPGNLTMCSRAVGTQGTQLSLCYPDVAVDIDFEAFEEGV